jgi:hypothetical protein
MKRDRDRTRQPSMAGLVDRFHLTDKHLRDTRIDKLLRHKLALDSEIAELIRSGARERRTEKIAKLLGFSELELTDPTISWVIQSVLDSRQCLATLKPKTKTRLGDKNVQSR